MKTNHMHTYLDQELIERLGIENEIFESGSFSFRAEEVEQEGNAAKQEEEEETKELERGQVRKVNPDNDSVLNSDAE